MTNPIQKAFVNGQTVNADDMNLMVNTINSLIADIGNMGTILAATTKSELVLFAKKSGQQIINGSNIPVIVDGWTTFINKNIMKVDPKTNISSILAPTTGTYTIYAKTLVSVDNSTSIRSKLIIQTPNTQGISENNSYQSSSLGVQNYRITHNADLTVNLSFGAPISIQYSIGDSSLTARIGENDYTTLKVYREITS